MLNAEQIKLVVPIMPRSLADIEALDLTDYQLADIIEWRADYVQDLDQLVRMAQEIQARFDAKKILFTYRTEQVTPLEVSAETYQRLIERFSYLDYIDIEGLKFPRIEIPPNAIISYHDWQGLPEDMGHTLSLLAARGGQLVKMAVSTQTSQDVDRVLAANSAFRVSYPDRQLVTIAMGNQGKVTRLTASDWTFCYVGQASAPGQVSLSEAYQYLKGGQDGH